MDEADRRRYTLIGGAQRICATSRRKPRSLEVVFEKQKRFQTGVGGGLVRVVFQDDDAELSCAVSPQCAAWLRQSASFEDSPHA